MLPVLEALVEAQPRAPGAPAPGGLGAALASLRPLLQPGSLVLVLSDFGSLDDRAETVLASASLHNDMPSAVGHRSAGKHRPARRQLSASACPDASGGWTAPAAGRPGGRPGPRANSDWGISPSRLDLPLNRLATSDAVADSLPPLLREAP